MLVVALLMLVMLGLGYYYSAGQGMETNTVVVAVRGYLSVEQKRALSEQLTGYAPESVTDIQLSTYEFPTANAENSGEITSKMFAELMTEIRAGGSDLLLVDRYVYEMFGDDTLFEDLSARYPGDPAVDGRYLYTLRGKPFLNAKGLEGLPESFLALRSSKSTAVNRNARTLEAYNLQCELLDNIAASTPPRGFAGQQGLEPVGDRSEGA